MSRPLWIRVKDAIVTRQTRSTLERTTAARLVDRIAWLVIPELLDALELFASWTDVAVASLDTVLKEVLDVAESSIVSFNLQDRTMDDR